MRLTKTIILVLVLLLLSLEAQAQTLPGELVVNNASIVASGKAYTWRLSLNVGSLQYIDRGFTFSQVPPAYQGLQYLQTSNDDKGYIDTNFLSFAVNQEVTVYVAHDNRISAKPSWLSAFTDTGDNLVSNGVTFSVYQKDYPRGTITLGGNVISFVDSSMYTVIVKGPGGSSGTTNLIADPQNPRWLKYYDGKPYFLAGPGDPEDFLYRGSRNADGTRNGDQMILINKLKGTAANSIYMQMVRSHGGDGDSTQNPFEGSNPANALDPDILNQWETWFTEMDNNNITIFLFFYDDAINVSSNLGWPLDGSGNLQAQEKYFIETIASRFKHHKNLVWAIMEEVQEMGSDYVNHAKKISETIKSADTNNHPVAVHKLSGLSFSEFADDPNIDQFAVQYNVATAVELHNGIVTAWNSASGRYNLNMSEAANFGTGRTARQKSWAIALGGAYVMALGMDIASTAVSDLQDMGRLRLFFESTDFTEMAPHDELKFDGTEYVLANPGESYIVYASNLAGNIGLKGVTAGTYDFKWLDVINGTTVNQAGVNVNSGNQSWLKPGGIGNEVAVYIRLSTPTSTVVFPGATWSVKTPAEVGLNQTKLAEFGIFLGGNGVVVRDGYQVYGWGNQTSRVDLASAAKPIYSTVLIKAVEEGKLTDLDVKVSSFEPCLNNINASLGYKDRNITFRHMANQISNYGVRENPGEAYDYNDWQMALFVDTLFFRVYGVSSWAEVDNQLMHGILGQYLQFQDNPTFLAFGSNDRAGRVAVSVRDHARFGWLYLNKGNWNGQQVISEQNVLMAVNSPLPLSIPRTSGVAAGMCPGQRSLGSTQIPDNQTDHNGSYSWLWWVNGVNRSGLRNWPDAPFDTYAACGHGNCKRAVVIIPSLNIVVAWNNTTLDSRATSTNPVNQALKLLIASTAGIRGDVNDDAQVNVLDVQACVNHILGIQDLGSRGDVNGDGSVDVLDVQNIVNIILGA